MTKRHLIIATRESPLAMEQAALVKKQLEKIHPHLNVELLGMTTQADRRLEVSLLEIGGKGLFVKELEEALLDGRADVAVHSMKDVPMDLPEGLSLPCILQREEPRDVFISNQYASFAELPRNASVGSSSLRRQSQLAALRSDLSFRNLRGNIQTRLRRLDEGDFAALVLAAAGLKRMKLAHRIRHPFSVEECLPAAGQGALGIECKTEDHIVQTLISPLNHQVTYDCVTAERALCRRLGGGCKVPVAAFAELHHDTLTLHGLVGSLDGTRILRAKRSDKAAHAESLGTRVAEELLQLGAEKILREFNV